jgi:hypothetical protein
MFRLLPILAVIATLEAAASGSHIVNKRLAIVVAAAVRETGLRINISSSDLTSVNINKINGVNVCADDAAGWVMQFQDALNRQPNIRDNFGPAYFTTTEKSGARKVLSLEDMKTRGFLKACTNIHVSVWSDV